MADDRSSDRLSEIASLIQSIRNKTVTVQSNTRVLKAFNSKIELFLEALNAYSVDTIEEEQHGRSSQNRANKMHTNINTSMETISVTPYKKQRQTADNMSAPAHTQGIHAPGCLGSLSAERLPPSTAISQLFSSKKQQREIAMEIYRLLEGSETVPLEEIVKRIKLSKYRVIEILNEMVRERIILKHFARGFFYRLNRDC